jgi:N-methylhydantoinase B/oxoprolinase/acetone carboxylase alpha subunit
MSSIHYDVVIYTNDLSKGIEKVTELIQEHNETVFKASINKVITDKRTYFIVNPNKQIRGLRYFEAYIENGIDQKLINEVIYPSCLPNTDNWKDRIHYF